MISHQPGGRGSWHIKLKKLKKKKVLPSSVKCDCASYGGYMYGYGGNASLCVGSQYQTTACSGSTNRACSSCTTCTVGSQYQTTAQ